MKTTSVSILLNAIRRLRAGLVLLAFAALGTAQNAHAANASHVNTQTAELEALLTAVHDVTSYNGNPQTAIDHLATWYELWAEDATLVVNGGAPKVGRDAIIAFFAANPLFKVNYVGLTPSFRTKISVHGDTAEVYLECIFLTEALTVGPQRALSGTAKKVDGKWLFWRMANNPAQPLFP
ncbi:MAG: hypothetical protein ABIZ04_01195 [Opitutus sp.]